MAVLVMSVEEALSRKLQDEARAGNIPNQTYLIQQFKQFLRTTYPATFKDESKPKVSDNQQTVQELMQIAKAHFLVDYTFADVIQASGYALSPSEIGTLGSMFASASKKSDSGIVNQGKKNGSKVTMYINKMD